MKRNEDFLLDTVAGSNILMPTGKALLSVNGMITLNETGVLLWELLENEHTADELVRAVCDEYDADEETVYNDIIAYIEKLKGFGCIEGEL